MPDPVTAIVSAKAVFAAIKKGIALAKKAGDNEVLEILLDAQEQALDLRDEVLSLRTERQELRAENAQLREALKLQGTVKYDDGAYWTENEERDGPFCTKCWDADERLIRMKHTYHEWFECPNCKTACQIPSGPGATSSPPPQRPPKDIY